MSMHHSIPLTHSRLAGSLTNGRPFLVLPQPEEWRELGWGLAQASSNDPCGDFLCESLSGHLSAVSMFTFRLPWWRVFCLAGKWSTNRARLCQCALSKRLRFLNSLFSEVLIYDLVEHISTYTCMCNCRL